MATIPSGATKLMKAAEKAGWTVEPESMGDDSLKVYVLTGENHGQQFSASWTQRKGMRWTLTAATILTTGVPEWTTATLLRITAVIKESATAQAFVPVSAEEVAAYMLDRMPKPQADQVNRFRSADAAPVTADEITEAMLTHPRRAAEESWCPQTVWPSRWLGKDFQGTACLLTNTGMGTDVPNDAYPDSAPILTVLPSRYYVQGQSAWGDTNPDEEHQEQATAEPEQTPQAISPEDVARGVYRSERTGPGTWQLAVFGSLFTIQKVAPFTFAVRSGTSTTGTPIAPAARSLPAAAAAAKAYSRANRAAYAPAA